MEKGEKGRSNQGSLFGLENINPDNLAAREKKSRQKQDHQMYRKMLLAWKKTGHSDHQQGIFWAFQRTHTGYVDQTRYIAIIKGRTLPIDLPRGSSV